MTSHVNWLFIVGVALVLLSFIFAFVIQFYHFYEFLLAGLFLILLYLTPPVSFTKSTYIRLYFAFVFFGLIVDIVIGLTITKLWHYSYEGLPEYILLYLLIYPLGGFVMLKSYLIGRHWLNVRNKQIRIPMWVFLTLSLVAIGMLVSVILLKESTSSSVWAVLFGVSAVVALGSIVVLFSEFLNGKSYIHDLIENTVPTIGITLIATYANFLIHEYPNVYAEQWIYAVHTGTVLDYHLFGVPFIVWLVWPFLIIGPVSLYYLVHFKGSELQQD